MELLITILILLVGWAGFEIIFYEKHKRPLTDAEIQSLANKRKRKFVNRKFTFMPRYVSVNKEFKSSLNSAGKQYFINEDLDSFPSLVGALLKGKKHEWNLEAVVKDNRITTFYTNKGNDRNSVYCFLSAEELIKMCENEGGCTILSFHNHPNAVLSASEQDYKSANYYGTAFSNAGVNYLAFVCGRGDFFPYYMKIAPTYYPENAKIENIAKENNLSYKQNYRLHRELGLIFRKHQNL